MSERIRFNDWQSQLAFLRQNMEEPTEVVVQLHIERDMYEYWREKTESEAVTDDGETDKFSINFEL